jgi:hypothetical protein
MSRKHSNRDRVEDEVLKTLEVLDALEDVEPGPYFFARLRANLGSPTEVAEPRLLSVLLGSRLAPTLLALVLVANVFTAVMVLKEDRDSQSEIRNEYVESLANEYLLTGTSSSVDVATE